MKINQRGFSPLYIIVMAIVIVAVGGGVYTIQHRRELSDGTNSAVARVVDETTVNGTPENAVKAVAEQVSTEITAEDAAMKLEEDATKLEDSVVDNLEGVANETNL